LKVSVWLVTRERATWITAAEILVLGVVLLAASSPTVRLLIGLPLLVHLGYKALTSLPMGSVPGRPETGQPRRNYDLRLRIVRFLDEVRRVEDYAQQAEVAGWRDRDVQEYLFTGQRRVMAAAREVAKETGRPTAPAQPARTAGSVHTRDASSASSRATPPTGSVALFST
jgi:hypothetical protein